MLSSLMISFLYDSIPSTAFAKQTAYDAGSQVRTQVPELANPNEEHFAILASRRVSLTQAAKSADLCEGGANNAGSRLAKTPRVHARIEELKQSHVEPHSDIAAKHPLLGSIDARVSILEARWLKLAQFIQERGQQPFMQKIPGGSTGYVAVTKKFMGNRFIREAKLDTPLLIELLGIERAVREELGQSPKGLGQSTKSVSLSFTDDSDLNKLLHDKIGSLLPDERRVLLEAMPELEEAIAESVVIGAVPQTVTAEDPED